MKSVLGRRGPVVLCNCIRRFNKNVKQSEEHSRGARALRCASGNVDSVSAGPGVGSQRGPSDRGASSSTGVVSPISSGSYYVSPAEVKGLMSSNKLSGEQLLRALIEPAGNLARPPISGFHVGALGLGGSGAIFVGVNLEFKGLALGQSVHAEQFLLANALKHGETRLECVALSAAPCGHCRQFYTELGCSDSIRFLFGSGPQTDFTLSELLPHCFGPEDLLEEVGPYLLEKQSNRVRLSQTAAGVVESRKNDSIFAAAAVKGLAEAEQCYVPYTKCPSAVALITSTGAVATGGCIESAAYNPTLPPLQSAIVNAIVDGMSSYDNIVEIVLLEVEGAPVSHAASIRNFIQKAAPNAKLTVLDVERC
ncbi:hypothetical protein BSKO_06974 [Bryopsis sp. KO-2023]|nr:hypothetical protein BSKO_06974 [Bryopsis sp. KO-2023]